MIGLLFKKVAGAAQNVAAPSHWYRCLEYKSMDAPDTVFVGYPANPKARYQISGQVGYRIFGLTTTVYF
jgi:hypothetical protein